MTLAAPAQDGAFPVNVLSTDAAGNTATDSRTLTVDRVTQVAITGVEGGNDTINAAEATGGIELSGTAEAGSTVVVNGVNATVAANGAWTVTLAAPAQDGAFPVNVLSTDAAGNTATDSRTLTVDTKAPTVASVAMSDTALEDRRHGDRDDHLLGGGDELRPLRPDGRAWHAVRSYFE